VKKLGLIVKEVSGKIIKDNLKDSDSVLVVNYSKLSSPDLSALRQSLRDSQANLFVVKNSVARLALSASGLEALIKNINGQCGLVFVKEEPVNASRVLFDFSKAHEQLQVEGGTLKNRLLNKKDIEALAKLPSKEVLRAQVVMALKSPINGIVFVLKGNLRKLVYCLEQIKNKKGG